jgi:hypothetical protein
VRVAVKEVVGLVLSLVDCKSGRRSDTHARPVDGINATTC